MATNEHTATDERTATDADRLTLDDTPGGGGGGQQAGDNVLRCRLVDDAGKLPMHSNFRNVLMSLLTLVRFSTGEGFIEIMHRSSF
jgi:hypothetical protein